MDDVRREGMGSAGAFAAGLLRRRDWRAALAETLRQEAEARTLFVLAPLGLMAGILLFFEANLRPPLLPTAAVAALVVAGGLCFSSAAARHLTLCLGFLLAGLAASAGEIARTKTVILSGETTTRIEGRVLWRDRDDRGRTRYLVAIEATTRPELSRPPSRVKLLVSARHAALPVGATYRGLVRMRPPSGPALPGGYDFAFGAFFDSVGAHGFALGAPTADASAAPPPTSLAERLVRLRLAISDRIRATIGGAEGAVAAALMAGERSGIPEAVNDWLRATGLSHVLSISGLHMALVAGFAMTLVRAGLALVPPLALRLPTKKIAAATALAVAAFYLALSGGDVATTRSFLMIAILLVAVLCDRPALTLRNVALAAVLILLVSPHALVTPGFQMSFGATVAIVAVYGAYAAHRRSDPGERRGIVAAVLVFLVGIAVSSLVAGAATAPFAAFHFQRVAPFGLVANMLALPIFSFWIMPLALIAAILMPFGLDSVPLVLLGHGLTLVFEIARRLSAVLPDDPTGRLTASGVLVLGLALILGCFLVSRLRLVAVPIALCGLWILPDRNPPPDLVLFEDGRELALVAADGTLTPQDRRPNRFVFDQWTRAFGRETPAASPSAFACEDTTSEPKRPPGLIQQPVDSAVQDAADPPRAAARLPAAQRPRRTSFCTATTRSGLRVAWTDDYRLLGRACDDADLALVARAARQTTCRSGARLVTLRSLRRTGSLAVSGSAKDLRIVPAIAGEPEPWTRHRLEPWPEIWRRPPGEGQAAVAPSR